MKFKNSPRVGFITHRHIALRAFSLVEVTLAVGLISVGMVTMLGLMPIGLTSMRDSTQTMVRSQIVQRISGEAMLKGFASLGDYAAPKYYYDGQGLRQDITSENKDTRFIVHLDLEDSADYPGSGNAESLASSIATLKVKVQSYPQTNEAAHYVIHIPNQGG